LFRSWIELCSDSPKSRAITTFRKIGNPSLHLGLNVIFGGDGGFPSKCVQKLTLCEFLFVEPAIKKPLRYCEVPISFSREDQWTSFSEPGKFPLVKDPVVAGL
jgi:hypothetical protein